MVVGIANGSQGSLNNLVVLEHLAYFFDRNRLAVGKLSDRYPLDFHLGSVTTDRC